MRDISVNFNLNGKSVFFKWYHCQNLITWEKRTKYKILRSRNNLDQVFFLKEIKQCRKNKLIFPCFSSYSGFHFKTIWISSRSLPPSLFPVFCASHFWSVQCAYAPCLFTILRIYKVFHFWKVRRRVGFLIQVFVICSMRTVSSVAKHLLWVFNYFSWDLCALPVDPPGNRWGQIILWQ